MSVSSNFDHDPFPMSQQRLDALIRNGFLTGQLDPDYQIKGTGSELVDGGEAPPVDVFVSEDRRQALGAVIVVLAARRPHRAKRTDARAELHDLAPHSRVHNVQAYGLIELSSNELFGQYSSRGIAHE
jgi:hypothetical protein